MQAKHGWLADFFCSQLNTYIGLAIALHHYWYVQDMYYYSLVLKWKLIQSLEVKETENSWSNFVLIHVHACFCIFSIGLKKHKSLSWSRNPQFISGQKKSCHLINKANALKGLRTLTGTWNMELCTFLAISGMNWKHTRHKLCSDWGMCCRFSLYTL